MNKKIVKFQEAVIGNKTKFSVISKNNIEKLIAAGAVKVEDWYVTPNGAIVAVIPDSYVVIDNNK